MGKEKIQKGIDNLLDLPGLPATVFETIQLLRDPDVSVKRLTQSIELDQSMTSKVLRLVNSSFYGVSGKISNIPQALVILGFNTVRNTILSVSAFEVFLRGGKVKTDGFDLNEFWKHAVGTGIIAKVLAQILRLPEPEDFFIAGLLHDIGKVVTIRLFQPEFMEILRMVEQDDLYILEAEKEILGFDHGYAGGCLAKKWSMPKKLKEAITLHHIPGSAKDDIKMTAVVHLADSLCRGLDIGHGGDILVPEIVPEALEVLEIDIGFIAGCLPEIDAEMEQSADFMTIFSI